MKWFWGILLLTLSGPYLEAQIHDHVQVAQQNMPAVVTVNTLKKDGSTYTATGFVLTPDGLIASNRHVLQDALYINLTFNNGTISGEAIPLAQSDTVDLALLKIQAHHLPYVTLGNSTTVQPGQTITVIGNPRRLQNTVTSGIISQLREQKNGTQWFQISAPISPSSSGSPVFNAQGQVIAVAFASLAGAENQNLNFAIPVNYLTQLVEKQQVQLPTPNVVATPQHPFWRHIQKSWQISKRLWNRWFHTDSEGSL
ncbi:MAG: serine protease [Elusimicrobiaceae bacterium]|nr:serine protease [Elusimicrobiaceae bacterium]